MGLVNIDYYLLDSVENVYIPELYRKSFKSYGSINVTKKSDTAISGAGISEVNKLQPEQLRNGQAFDKYLKGIDTILNYKDISPAYKKGRFNTEKKWVAHLDWIKTIIGTRQDNPTINEYGSIIDIMSKYNGAFEIKTTVGELDQCIHDNKDQLALHLAHLYSTKPKQNTYAYIMYIVITPAETHFVYFRGVVET